MCIRDRLNIHWFETGELICPIISCILGCYDIAVIVKHGDLNTWQRLNQFITTAAVRAALPVLDPSGDITPFDANRSRLRADFKRLLIVIDIEIGEVEIAAHTRLGILTDVEYEIEEHTFTNQRFGTSSGEGDAVLVTLVACTELPARVDGDTAGLASQELDQAGRYIAPADLTLERQDIPSRDILNTNGYPDILTRIANDIADIEMETVVCTNRYTDMLSCIQGIISISADIEAIYSAWRSVRYLERQIKWKILRS